MSGAKIDWDSIRLVAFDVDGTLYNQRAMRLRMLRELVSNVVRTRSLTTLRTLRAYRRIREKIGDEEIENFEDVLVARTAAANRVSQEAIRSIVAEWIESRPLAHIHACRYAYVDELFLALKLRGKTVGILSDYPALDKLNAMGLAADHVVAASDANVGILKPHPRGLEMLMAAAGASPSETVLVGDRIERDGMAARRAGVMPLIRSDRPLDGWLHFSRFSDAQFAPLFDRSSG